MLHEFSNLILALTIIIIAAKLSGYVSVRLGQPSVLGELLAGIILGPTLLNMFSWPVFHEDHLIAEVITMMAELGVILLMMLAGLELNLEDLARSGKVSAISGTLGVFVPLILGAGAALLFGMEMDSAIFIGLTLSATSVSISAQTLLELNVLRSRVGLTMLGAAVFDDILVILALSLSVIILSDAGGGIASIVVTLLKMITYIILATGIGLYLVPPFIAWIERLPISQGLVAFSFVLCLLYAWAAEVIGGMATITGAFLLGLFLARLPFKHRIEQGIIALSYGFFVPIFFVNIGLTVNMRAISGTTWILAILITIIAIVSKILGSGLGAKLGGYTNLESLQLGIGMVSRGEVGLIVASLALAEGFLSPEMFSVVVFMVIMATLVTPPMLRVAFTWQPKKPETA
ncbi:MAG: sodium:proton exchanger [Chloroflexi bacterium]|nr:MAG: sodium:proton exchanger [Chloroflexota bacterium]